MKHKFDTKLFLPFPDSYAACTGHLGVVAAILDGLVLEPCILAKGPDAEFSLVSDGHDDVRSLREQMTRGASFIMLDDPRVSAAFRAEMPGLVVAQLREGGLLT